MQRTRKGAGKPARRALLSAALLLGIVAPSGPAAATSAPPSGEVVRDWNDLALGTVRRHNASDAQAARLYAMVNVAVYDAVNGLSPRSERRDEALVRPSSDARGDARAAAAGAARDVLAALYPSDTAIYDAQLASDLAAIGSTGQAAQGREWGGRVAAEVLEARADDGSSPNQTQLGGSGPGVFSANWSGVQFRRLEPFAIEDSARFMGEGPPALDSAEYAAAFDEVKAVGDADVPDPQASATFQFWSLGGRTSQPPGAWVQVAQAVSASRSLPLADTARLFALETMAMADTVAPTYATKFDHHFWRPMFAIREAGTDGNDATVPDPEWRPRAGGPGTSPEHWSGHSSFSSSAATVLAGFFCTDDVSFTLVTDSAPGGQARTYGSFSEAADEAGRSRVVGGIHFEFSNQAGLAAGRAVAAEVLARGLQPTKTADGEDCPASG